MGMTGLGGLYWVPQPVRHAGEYQAAVELAQAGGCSHGGHGWDGETCDEVPAPPCPCCQRELPLAGEVCGECAEAGCEGSEFATPELPYPYCAATDSSPLA